MYSLSNCRIVLVRTHYPGNIGAAARAMKNFGLRDLVLVDPVADVNAHQARMLATNGVDILDSARIVPDLDSAVADCGVVLATAGETIGTLRETVRGTPAEVMPGFAEALAAGPCALVFGPEPHGLTTAEVGRCHGLLHLPADPEYSSLNLSLAVGICLYELRKAACGLTIATRREPAPFADLDRAFAHLHEALAQVSFLYGQNADALMHAVRHLIARAQPTAQEVKLLHGLARQLLYVAQFLPRDKPSEPPA
jgi:tRNA/rRNA methyltransferase